ncbi:hypothetical protein AVEN_194572-1 [Araneus ventricosus]|uniref:Uncharacterized protein n=1 Tax=Araneus ventricosus TaxID=182803 RepID=A0A4Y2A7S9_ARAVE|nr:hypothetical protein AVEN_194572-1 [Araneus ventricosus]
MKNPYGNDVTHSKFEENVVAASPGILFRRSFTAFFIITIYLLRFLENTKKREEIGENREKLLKSWRLPPKAGELAGLQMQGNPFVDKFAGGFVQNLEEDIYASTLN